MKILLFDGDAMDMYNYTEDLGPRTGEDVMDRLEVLRDKAFENDTVPYDLSFGVVDIPDDVTDWQIRTKVYAEGCCECEYVLYVLDGKIHDAEVEYDEWERF